MELFTKLEIIQKACQSFEIDEIISAAIHELFWRSLPLRIFINYDIEIEREWFKRSRVSYLYPKGKNWIESMNALFSDNLSSGNQKVTLADIEGLLKPREKQREVLLGDISGDLSAEGISNWTERAECYLRGLRDLYNSEPVTYDG